MGSPLRLVTHGAAERAARRAWRAVVSDIERSEAALSRFRPESDLSRLNVAAPDGWGSPHRRLLAMLSAGRRAQRMTAGRFDPRVIRALEALGEEAGVPLPRIPKPAADDPWLERAGRCRVRLRHPVDSGGIGKGLALRWARRAAREALGAAPGLLIEAGGDIVTAGPGPDDGQWTVAIEDPLRPNASPAAVLRTGQAAVATSSVTVRRWIAPDGSAAHHLIDPRTGSPSEGGLLAVTVWHADPAWAEVWSKALFLAGAAEIGPEARRRGMAAWWVEADGSLHLTPAARSLTIWTRAEAGAA